MFFLGFMVGVVEMAGGASLGEKSLGYIYIIRTNVPSDSNRRKAETASVYPIQRRSNGTQNTETTASPNHPLLLKLRPTHQNSPRKKFKFPFKFQFPTTATELKTKGQSICILQ